MRYLPTGLSQNEYIWSSFHILMNCSLMLVVDLHTMSISSAKVSTTFFKLYAWIKITKNPDYCLMLYARLRAEYFTIIIHTLCTSVLDQLQLINLKNHIFTLVNVMVFFFLIRRNIIFKRLFYFRGFASCF